MGNPAATEQSSSQELFFLYELAKVFSSSLKLDEVAEYVLDGACALIGTEQGFLCALENSPTIDQEEAEPVLRPYVLRGLSLPALQAIIYRLRPTWAERQGITLGHAAGSKDNDEWKDLMAAPLIVRDHVHGILGVSTATARAFTDREQERLVSVSNLGSLALENARLHDQIQCEVKMLRRLIQAAKQMGEGKLSDEQITELENSAGWDEISRLSQTFAQMARQVIEREEDLRQQVRTLEIIIDEAKRERQVAEITETDYFRHLQEKVENLKGRRR